MRYIGDDFEADMGGIKDSETTRKWWAVSKIQ
jgi:L-rhamnose mutarotase